MWPVLPQRRARKWGVSSVGLPMVSLRASARIRVFNLFLYMTGQEKGGRDKANIGEERRAGEGVYRGGERAGKGACRVGYGHWGEEVKNGGEQLSFCGGTDNKLEGNALLYRCGVPVLHRRIKKANFVRLYPPTARGGRGWGALRGETTPNDMVFNLLQATE